MFDRGLAHVHLGIDVRESCRELPAGKGHWTTGFVSELLLRNVPLTLFTDAPLPPAWTDAMRTQMHHVILLARSGMRWHWDVARYLKSDSQISAYVSPVSYIVPSLLGNVVPTIPIVHDLVAFRREPHNRKAQMIERLTLRRAIHSAAHVCTVSHATKSDLLARYPALRAEAVTPIFAGPGNESPVQNTSDSRTILCIGTLCPRKNQKRLIGAFSSLPSPLRERSRLILVGGRGWKDADIVRLAERTAGVEWRGYLSDDECRTLLSQAAVFALPSLYEGFGLPVLDAMCAGVPVVTSDRGSLREVAADAAVFVDPEDVSSICDGVVRLLSDEALRTKMVANGMNRARAFSWPHTVDLFLQALGTIDKRL